MYFYWHQHSNSTVGILNIRAILSFFHSSNHHLCSLREDSVFSHIHNCFSQFSSTSRIVCSILEFFIVNICINSAAWGSNPAVNSVVIMTRNCCTYVMQGMTHRSFFTFDIDFMMPFTFTALCDDAYIRKITFVFKFFCSRIVSSSQAVFDWA